MNHVDSEQLRMALAEYLREIEFIYNRPPLRSDAERVEQTRFLTEIANAPVKTQRKDVYGNVPPINLSLTSRVAYDRIAQLEADVARLQRIIGNYAVVVRQMEEKIAALTPKMEQKPSTGDLLARASSFDRPLDPYGR